MRLLAGLLFFTSCTSTTTITIEKTIVPLQETLTGLFCEKNLRFSSSKNLEDVEKIILKNNHLVNDTTFVESMRQDSEFVAFIFYKNDRLLFVTSDKITVGINLNTGIVIAVQFDENQYISCSGEIPYILNESNKKMYLADANYLDIIEAQFIGAMLQTNLWVANLINTQK